MTIKPLERTIISDGSIDGIQTSRLPTNVDMMNKINEIVHAYNRLEQSVTRINGDISLNQMIGNLKRGIR